MGAVQGKGEWSDGELSCKQAGSSGSCRALLRAARLLCLLISGSCHPILACSAFPAAVHEKLMPGPGPCCGNAIRLLTSLYNLLMPAQMCFCDPLLGCPSHLPQLGRFQQVTLEELGELSHAQSAWEAQQDTRDGSRGCLVQGARHANLSICARCQAGSSAHPHPDLPSRPSEEHSLHEDQLFLPVTPLVPVLASGEAGCASAEQGHGFTGLCRIPSVTLAP